MVLHTPPSPELVESIIPLADEDLSRKDYASDVDTRWCPGCGDYSILAQMQRSLSNINVAPEKMVFVSGIGCSSRFPYYMNTYGMHSIHGRAPTIASGLKLSRPDLQVFVITGDGDALSIGGNHLLHVLRRNVDVKIFLFNNRIYGLTKGQYSPTSELGKVTKSSPVGTTERPLNPLSVALASEATFVARSYDTDPQHLQVTIEQAARHHGAAFVEILQNCNIFNDRAFADYTDRDVRDERLLYLEHGQQMLFGENKNKGLAVSATGLRVVDADGPDAGLILHHDATRPAPDVHQLLARCAYPEMPVPMGVIRQVTAPTYGDYLDGQIEVQKFKNRHDITQLLRGRSTWQVE
ncbi:MAG: 2-oxoacid:ferredoxin oxidoreductase subunit beta [Chloroflexi bacterium]|nr:2-oxoacid:ferredoxin oxidoreductase subunit beta [Chloroflexota bacterium]MCY3696150.1 2-oxoacid:ferredoxin oxidoreductase subunit beta [Chloroflexota bacterium]